MSASHSKGLHSLDHLTTLKKNCLNIFLFLRQSYKVVHDIRAMWLRYLSGSWQPGLMWLLWPARAVSLLPHSTQLRGPPSSSERLIPKHGYSLPWTPKEAQEVVQRDSLTQLMLSLLLFSSVRHPTETAQQLSIHRQLFRDTGWTPRPQLTQ